MPRIDISIAGRSFPVSCAEGEEDRVSAIAEQIDGRIQQMRRSVATATDMHLLVMASLMMGDEMMDLQAEVDRLATEGTALPAESGNCGASADEAALATTISDLAARVEALVDGLSEA